jgi:hypothetical protein
MKLRPEWSQRLLRKGVLVKETYELFASWDDALSDVENLKSALSGRFKTAGWEREVNATLHRRLRHFDRIRPLVALAKGGMSMNDCGSGSERPSSRSMISESTGCSLNTKKAGITSGRTTCMHL